VGLLVEGSCVEHSLDDHVVKRDLGRVHGSADSLGAKAKGKTRDTAKVGCGLGNALDSVAHDARD